jgi:hypothetical protein
VILLVGDPEDLSAAYVAWLAEQRGIEVVGLPESRLGLDWWISAPGEEEVSIEAAGRVLHGVTGAFVRLNPEPAVADELGVLTDAVHLYVQERRAGLSHLLEMLDVPVINRPSAGRSNGSKPLQMARLAAFGFDVPRWAATNEPAVAEELQGSSEHGCVVKACSGLRSHVRTLSATTLDEMRAGTVPLVVQHLVPGHEVRVHVVGASVFATSVASDAIDYRFDSDEVDYQAAIVAPELGDLCRRFATAEGLTMAGFDFRVDEEGRHWCLEMNPVPTYLPYEASSGQRIGDAVVDLLAPGTTALHDGSPLAERLRTE